MRVTADRRSTSKIISFKRRHQHEERMMQIYENINRWLSRANRDLISLEEFQEQARKVIRRHIRRHINRMRHSYMIIETLARDGASMK